MSDIIGLQAALADLQAQINAKAAINHANPEPSPHSHAVPTQQTSSN